MSTASGGRSSFEDLAAVLFYPAVDEVEALLGSQSLDYEDLTACEAVTMAGILRAAWERKQARQNVPVVLEMVRNQSH